MKFSTKTISSFWGLEFFSNLFQILFLPIVLCSKRKLAIVKKKWTHKNIPDVSNFENRKKCKIPPPYWTFLCLLSTIRKYFYSTSSVFALMGTVKLKQYPTKPVCCIFCDKHDWWLLKNIYISSSKNRYNVYCIICSYGL